MWLEKAPGWGWWPGFPRVWGEFAFRAQLCGTSRGCRHQEPLTRFGAPAPQVCLSPITVLGQPQVPLTLTPSLHLPHKRSTVPTV